MGTLRLMPKILALMAVQRQTAASTSASPWTRLQQGAFGRVPTTRWNKSFNRPAHTPSLRVSLGQAGVGLSPARIGCGFTEGCFGVFGGDGGHPQGRWAEETIVKKRRLREITRKAMVVIAFEPIFRHACSLAKCMRCV
jgi:hypothetical protein